MRKYHSELFASVCRGGGIGRRDGLKIHFHLIWSTGSIPVLGSLNIYLFIDNIMWFIVRRTWDLNTNERMISFYKKELRSSHILDKAKKQEHYGTKWYRKFVSYDFPSFRRYNRMKAVVSNAYKTNKKKYNTLAQLWKIA